MDICRNQILKLEIYELRSNWKSRLKHCSSLQIYQQRVWLMKKPLSLWINHAVVNQTIQIHRIFSQRIVLSDAFDAMSSKARNGQQQASRGGNCSIFSVEFLCIHSSISVGIMQYEESFFKGILLTCCFLSNTNLMFYSKSTYCNKNPPRNNSSYYSKYAHRTLSLLN